MICFQSTVSVTPITIRRRSASTIFVNNNSSSMSPLSSYGILTGELFLYASGRAAFESLPSCPSKCILLGGLSDGLLPVPYTGALQDLCTANDWSLVQPVLSSSYMGFGNGRLERDCAEIQELLTYLREHRQLERVGFVGHSTGCQDIAYLLQHTDAKCHFCVLQAPVSDREGSSNTDYITQAQNMVKDDKGDEMLPRVAFWAPITAQRYVDLQAPLGMDDFFSSDLTDAQLEERLGGNAHQCSHMLVVGSGCDEYVPASVLEEYPSFLDRLARFLGGTSLHLPTANHNLSVGEVDDFLKAVGKLLK